MNNIEIAKFSNYEPRFNGVNSSDNLPRKKDGMYVINLDGKKSKRTHWVTLFIDRNTSVYFDYFGIEYIPQEVLSKIKDKWITNNIFRIQADDSMMCGFYCITVTEVTIAGKTLLDYTNLFFRNDNQKNDKIL